MSGVRWASLCCLLLAADVATAETTKPRNILEFLFGQRRTEEPRSIAPPATAAQPAAAPKAAQAKQKQKPVKHLAARKHDGSSKAKTSLRRSTTKTAALQTIDPDNAPQPAPGSYRGPFRGGGNTAYCVRTCDGFFFPINHSGAQGADRYETACQTSCPGAQTEVYFMKRGGDIKWSSSARGDGYMRLANALKYRKERDPACTCKGQEQNWSSILAPVETMMRHAKTDMVVTEEASNEIMRGEDPVAAARKAEQQKAEQQKIGEKQAGQATPDVPPVAGKRAEISSESRATHIRSSFGERIAPSDRFMRIDPESTGSLPEMPKKSTEDVAKPITATLPAKAESRARPAVKGKPEAKAKIKSEARAKSETGAKAVGKGIPRAKAKTEVSAKDAAKTEQKTAKSEAVRQVAEGPKAAPAPAASPAQDRSGLRQALERLFSADKR